MTLDELWPLVAGGAVDNVIVAVPDLQGRLVGSRLDPEHFRDRVLAHGFDACVYLLAVDVDMATLPGSTLDAEAYGDMVLAPDVGTLRVLPWDPGTALVIADARTRSGQPIGVAPRQVLHDQLARLDALGLRALAGTELEFLLFREDPERAAAADYRALTPASRANVDYGIGLGAMEPVVRRIRREMRAAGLTLESARGECHPGQYEIVFRYDDALRTCDNHVLYKSGARQIAAAEGMALTFMAKFDGGEGNSCHVHLSLRTADGEPVFARGDGMSPLMRQFVAGLLACAGEFALLAAPNVNSYKRLAPGAFAPTTIAWGLDNRTCAVRVVGAGESLRVEYRVPGGDANPYLAVAAVLAAGLHGLEHELELEPPRQGSAWGLDGPHLPASLAEALALWESSAAAATAFGADVRAHYAAAARAELTAFGAAVTDWERRRGFDRL